MFSRDCWSKKKKTSEQKEEDKQAKTKCFDEFVPITAPSSLGEEKSCFGI